jgi:tetratricopeptide (TPR) repeat protein
MNKLETLLHDFIQHPAEQEILFNLGWEYEAIGQTAAAVSFYLRTCEFGNDIELQYESLVRMGICFMKQGNRNWIAKGQIQRAISLLPKRPEAYYVMSELYYNNGEFQESYTAAVMGLANATDLTPSRSHLKYPGRFGLIYRKALGAFKIGLFQEHYDLLMELKHDKSISPAFLEIVNENIKGIS